MFNKRRSEIQIIGEILRLSMKGAKKTDILYQSNMSFAQLQQYLEFLLKNDILREDMLLTRHGMSSKVYVTTAKGHDLLRDINKTLSYFKDELHEEIIR
jgi:predicted transcriptional regulator